MVENILKYIYPPKCGICGKLDKEYLCKRCQKMLENETIWEIKQNVNPYIFFKNSYQFLNINELLEKRL